MPELIAFLALALFAALVVAFFAVFRRAARVVAETREDEGFRDAAAGLTDRATALIAAGTEKIDRVRRRQDAPASVDDLLPRMQHDLGELRAEAGALVAPASLVALRDRLAEELDRASRALEMVEHGCALLGATAGRPREMEGETAVKRGYLNLLHAREALLSLGVDLRAGRLTPSRWITDRVPPT